MKKNKKNFNPSISSSDLSLKENNNSEKRDKLPIYIFFIILIGAAGFLFFRNIIGNSMQKYQKELIPNIVKKILNSPNTKVSVTSIKEISGVYEFELVLTQNGKEPGQKYISYLTKDGKILFTSGLKIDDLTKKAQDPQDTTPAKKLTCNDISKSDKPMLTAFVVSNCPYGIQMQRVMNKALAEQPDLASHFNVKYIGAIDNGKITSMHGDKEAQENLQQICIREEQNDKYWPYVSCYIQEGKSEECLTTADVNAQQLKTCLDDPNKGIAYAKKDFDMAKKFNVTGSPGLIVNEKQTVSEFDFGGRIADSVKKLVCCASKTEAEYCKKDLSKTEIATSFSKTIEAQSGTSTNTNAGCEQ